MITVVLPEVRLDECAVPLAEGSENGLTVPGLSIPEKRIEVDPGAIRALLATAREAASRAHAPYSNFHVGAAVVMADDPDGRVFPGCNIENATYGATVCAERNAISTATGEGFREIRYLAVSTVDSLAGKVNERSPCGICRQVIAEFSRPETLVFLDNGDANDSLGDVVDVDRLLPFGFRLEA